MHLIMRLQSEPNTYYLVKAGRALFVDTLLLTFQGSVEYFAVAL